MKESFDKLIKLNKKLRKECQWDREQTIHSYAKHLVEESNEVLEAIEENDADELREELGDVLYGVIFLIEICDEAGLFSGKELLEKAHEKIIRRHPHVFIDKTDDMDKVWDMYNEVKAKEKEAKKDRVKRPIK